MTGDIAGPNAGRAAFSSGGGAPPILPPQGQDRLRGEQMERFRPFRYTSCVRMHWSHGGGDLMRASQRWRFPVTLAALLATAFALSSGAGGDTATNGHFAPAGTIGLPGLGMSLAWSPAGDALAAGGHFRDKVTKQRYDTRVVDVRGMGLAKSFSCHYWWAIAQAWQKNPYLGDVIADGGGDHAVKIWSTAGPGSKTCSSPGQLRREDGGIKA